MILRRAEVPDCSECDTITDIDDGFEDAEQEFISKTCEACPWSKRIFNPRLDRLLYYMALIDAGCPVGRHELRNDDWLAMRTLKSEQEKMIAERAKNETKHKDYRYR